MVDKIDDINFKSVWWDYAHVSGIVEQVVHTSVNRYYIPDMQPDDLAQEIRIKCLKAMEVFDPTRIGPSPFKFLAKVAKNHIYNLARGTFVPNNPPCNRCPLYDKATKICTVNEVGCEAIVEFRQKMAAKAALRTATERVIDPSSDSNLDFNAQILSEHFRYKLPEELQPYYDALIDGRHVPQNIKVKLRKLIKCIINETA